MIFQRRQYRIPGSRWPHIILGLLSSLLVLTTQPVQAIAPSDVVPVTMAASSNTAIDEGRALYAAGHFSEAATTWQAATQAYASDKDYLNQALSLSYLSLAYQALNQWEQAQQATAQSLDILQSSGMETEAIVWAQALNTQASLQLHMGQAEAALETWENAQTFYQQAGDTLGALGSQINQAQALQSLGFYRRSRQQLESIYQQLVALPDSDLKVSGLRSLGVAHRVIGDLSTSRDILLNSAEIAQNINAITELSTTYLSLGITATDWGDPDAALSFFEQAEQTALNPSARLQAQLSRLRLYVDYAPWQSIAELIPPIHQQLMTLQPSRTAVYGAVNFVASLAKVEPQKQPLSAQSQGKLLAQAVQSARMLRDGQAEAYALQQWGKLYEKNGQWSEALELTQKSLTTARAHQANDIVAQSAWQLGRVLKKQGQKQAAISAYTEAVNALQTLRGDLVAINPDAQFSYRESVEPVYREFVALLLEGSPNQTDLEQAREVIEALQLAELDNFFREACLDVEAQQIDQVDSQAAVIYPIILPDHLAVVLSTPGQPLRYHAIPVSSTVVEETLRELLTYLHPALDNAKRLELSQQVYDWLILPQADTLEKTQTLVFVLDGLLRNVPVSALHDGEHYLIEKHAVALSPGLQLMASQTLGSITPEAIVGGISEARNGFSALPAVASEVTDISKTMSANTLLNQEFTSEALADTVSNSPSNLVHLATHGQFSSRLEDTFLLTWEGRLSVRELSEMLQSHENHQGHAIELLVLSACDTAAGDDRAVLGLAGLAVKSGARSTIATLWPVKDQAAALLMTDFYQQLQVPGISKAEALRRAQLTLLSNPTYSDPFFWSTYTLVGNWL
ncbi:CHAT domain-containing protein [Leptothoe spongobia TAU-MAC 1115]|uniref:CHAT domain-containing protein n=2 Tax=Leptothoe TaxID=2651725 RepID=A0A947GMB0_9CYAN|nr:CHAT domain-containing protein [Leptothoe spongobia TAU-MAC 1115]